MTKIEAEKITALMDGDIDQFLDFSSKYDGNEENKNEIQKYEN